MPDHRKDGDERVVELLEKLIVLELHAQGATQDTIAAFLSKSKSWVNTLVKSLPKRHADE